MMPWLRGDETIWVQVPKENWRWENIVFYSIRRGDSISDDEKAKDNSVLTFIQLLHAYLELRPLYTNDN